MNEEEIRQYLDQACGDPSLYFQIMSQDSYLYIFINRQSEALPDYDRLTETISTTIAQLQIPDVQYLALYSRLMGEENPDWEICLDIPIIETKTQTARSVQAASDNDQQLPTLIQADSTVGVPAPSKASQANVSDLPAQPVSATSQTAPETSPEVSAQISPQLDTPATDEFARYCFVRDKTRLNEAVDLPKTIAQSLLLFHQLSSPQKHQVLGNLGKIFKNPALVNNPKVPETIQRWFQSVPRSNPEVLNQYALWLSRYCANPEKTIEEIRNSEFGISPAETLRERDVAAIRKSPETLPAESEPEKFVAADPLPSSEPSVSAVSVEEAISPGLGETSTSESSSEPLDLSETCFIRNKLMLTAELKPPSDMVAKAILAFHELDNRQKYALLPTLDQLFRSPESVKVDQFSENIQTWLQSLVKANSDDSRKAGIWFSRYCYDPQKTIAELQGTVVKNTVETPAPSSSNSADSATVEQSSSSSITYDASVASSSTSSSISYDARSHSSTSHSSTSSQTSRRATRPPTFPIVEFVVLAVVACVAATIAKAVFGTGLLLGTWIGFFIGIGLGIIGQPAIIFQALGANLFIWWFVRAFLPGILGGSIFGGVLGFGVHIIADRYFEKSGQTKPIDFSSWLIQSLMTRDGGIAAGTALGCFLLVSSVCLGSSSPCGCMPSVSNTDKYFKYEFCSSAEQSLGQMAFKQHVQESIPWTSDKIPAANQACSQSVNETLATSNGEFGSEEMMPDQTPGQTAPSIPENSGVPGLSENFKYGTPTTISKGIYLLEYSIDYGEYMPTFLQDMVQLKEYCLVKNSAAGLEVLYTSVSQALDL